MTGGEDNHDDHECKVKPIKGKIFTKKRNRLLDPEGVTLFRALQNLKHIMAAKKAFGKSLADSLV